MLASAEAAAVRQQLASEGFVRIQNLFARDEVEHLRTELSRCLTEGLLRRAADSTPLPTGSAAPMADHGILYNNLWEAVPTFKNLATDGRLGRMAAAILNVPAVRLFQDNLVWKPPGTRDPLEWHQDFSYWPLDAPTGLTTWVALDDADPLSGCLQYVRGSHGWGERQPADFIRGSGQPEIPGLPPLEPDKHHESVVAVPVKAGDLVIHHPLTWHMSSHNEAIHHRRAWTATWLVDGVRWDPDHAPHPFSFEMTPTKGQSVQGERFPRFSRQSQ